jgi:hypothetical protein
MKKAALIMAVLLLAGPVFARGLMDRKELQSDYVPPPVLLSPSTEDVDLTGKDILEFKWSPHEGIRGIREYYDFRLYKGYNTVESTLILKERLSGDTYQYNLAADKFEEGQTYTWTLRQVYSRLLKSDPSHASFKIIIKK